MSIPITQEDESIYLWAEQEECVFCSQATSWRHLETNHPCCPICSVKYEVEEILNAKFNY